MIAVRWIYVFYRNEDVDFVGNMEESMSHYDTSKDHIQWLSTPTAKRRAEAKPESRKLYCIKVDPDKLEEE